MIDKFYRVYNPYSKPEARSFKETTLNLKDDGWNALNYKISSVKGGEFTDDVSTLGQTLTRKGDAFVQGNTKYKFLESKSNNWNANKRKITNVKRGESSTDVPTLEQTLIRKDGVFVQDKNNYEFLESENGIWNAKKRKISNLLAGKESDDVVNVSQVPKMDLNFWDFNNKRLVRVKPAVDENDCVTKHQTVTLDGLKFDGKNKQLTNILPGTLPNDVAVVKQILTKGEKSIIKQGDKYYNVLTLDRDMWDAEDKLIKNVPEGKDRSDICLMSQVLRYDDNIKTFRQDNIKFDICLKSHALRFNNKTNKFMQDNNEIDLMMYNPKLLVADPTSLSGFKTLDGEAYLPKNYVYQRMSDGMLIGSNGGVFETTETGRYVNIKNKE